MPTPFNFQPTGYHRFCTAFPPADETDFQNVVDSMKAVGYQVSDPIVLYGTEILDGRTRYEASLIAEVAPLFIHFEGTEEEARRFVFRKNLARRHLTDAQRAALVAMIPGLTTKERAEIANVHKTLQRDTDVVATNAPEFLPVIVKGQVSPWMLQPVTKDQNIRQDALKYLQKEDIDGLLTLLRGGTFRSLQSFKGTAFEIKRTREIGNMIKFNRIFSEIQSFLSKLDGVTELIKELAKAEKGFEQKQLWEHFTTELQSVVPDLQASIKKTIADVQSPPRQYLLDIWDGILDEIKQQSHLVIKRKIFSPTTIPGPTRVDQQNQIYEKFSLFLEEILAIAKAMGDDSQMDLKSDYLSGKPSETRKIRKKRIPKTPGGHVVVRPSE